jgi:PII-like signaling protein
MKTTLVTFVRIYLTEGERHLDSLLKRLHDVEKVRGVTVFRGVSGFGHSGKVHSSRLLDLSSDLPLVVEFFDEPSKVEMILSHLENEFESGHVVQWSANINI